MNDDRGNRLGLRRERGSFLPRLGCRDDGLDGFAGDNGVERRGNVSIRVRTCELEDQLPITQPCSAMC